MEEIVVCSGLTKEYGAFPALMGVSLSLYGGRAVAVTGSSGSGKSTFLKLMAGLIRPTDGELLLFGEEPSFRSRGSVAYLPDRDMLPERITPEGAVKLWSRYFRDFDCGHAMRLFADCNVDIVKRLGSMSRGTRAAVQLILALSRSAGLYLLDEPFTALDGGTASLLGEAVLTHVKAGACVAAAAHDVGELAFRPDDVIRLRSGTVLRYGPAEEVPEC